MDNKVSKKQADILKNANSRWNLYTGAVRSGKSYITNILIPKRLKNLPDGRRAIIGKTETTIMRNILDPMQDMYGQKYVSDIEGKKREATIFGKKFYAIGANDARAVKKLQGAGLQYAVGDEITTWPEEFFQMLKSRLDKKGAMFDGTCNPEGPYHWLKKDFIDNKNLDVYHQHFTIDDNPFLDNLFVEELKKEYAGVWYDRYILGKWVLAEGLIYPMFDDNNLFDRKDMPSYQQEWIGVDYGTSNDTVFELIRLGDDNVLYVVDEWRYGAKNNGQPKDDTQLRVELQEFIKRNKANPDWIFIDPSAKSFITELYHHRQEFQAFYNVAGANNKVLDGIRRISSLLHNNVLKVEKTLDKLQEEFHSYSWDPRRQELGEDKPIKKYDHGLDGIRYIGNGIPRIVERVLMNAE